jgi:hypothetical protein
MTLDAAPIARLTAALMDMLERDYGDRESVELRAAMVLVDIEAPDPDGDEGTWTLVLWHFGERSSEWDHKRSSSAYAAGLVGEAYVGLTSGSDELPGDDG